MDTNNTNTQPEEAEVIETPETSAPRGSLTIVELTTIINRYEADIAKVKEGLKMQNGMFKDAFGGDKEFHEMDMKVKEMNKQKNAIKQRILKTPAMEAVVAKIDELKSEIKDAQETLSGYLEEYQRVSGTNIIEGENGEIKEIIPVYKLVKRGKV